MTFEEVLTQALAMLQRQGADDSGIFGGAIAIQANLGIVDEDLG